MSKKNTSWMLREFTTCNFMYILTLSVYSILKGTLMPILKA